MRIIAGQARGLPLMTPPGGSTRPMDGRARGALFNILLPRLAGAKVLDLYAGSGAVGLEALSRGAELCVFVERDRRAAAVLQENLRRSRLEGGELLCAPVVLGLARLLTRGARFDLVFYDPPFPQSREAASRAELMREMGDIVPLLDPDSALVMRLERRNYYPEELPGQLEGFDRREYGRSLLVFLRPRGPAGPGPLPSPAAPPPAAEPT
jgi:16S rRNA (guanine966-N2)-methyltransferase